MIRNTIPFIKNAPPKSASVILEKLTMPEKLKGGWIERLVNFWKNVAIDYKEATKDLIESSQKRPLKAFIIASIASGSFYLNKTRPNNVHFRDSYLRMHHELTLLPTSQRNQTSQEQRDKVTKCENSGTLRFQNLGIATLVWEDNYGSNVGLYSSQCDYLKPTYLDILKDRVVDFGINGHWLIQDKVMEHFDINDAEWDAQGRPVKPDGQLKHMW
jgi:hypothetical protein